MKQAIRLEEVTKVHEGVTVVSDMNLIVEKGTVVGIVGSTYEKASIFMKLLAGELTLCQGEIYYEEERLGLYGQVPEYVGVYISDIGFINEFTGFKNLKYIAGMNGIAGEKEICEAMEFVGLSSANRQRVSQYSPRMRQKLSIAQAVMEGQKLLLLDGGIFTEVNEGNRSEIRKILVRLKKLGFTIVAASEKAEYIDRFCDQIVHI